MNTSAIPIIAELKGDSLILSFYPKGRDEKIMEDLSNGLNVQSFFAKLVALLAGVRVQFKADIKPEHSYEVEIPLSR